MKQIYSKINFLHNKSIIFENIICDISTGGVKKDEIFNVIDGELKKISERINHSKNIFSIYRESTHGLYSEICKYVESACSIYSISKNKQKYFIYGKVVKYTKDTNSIWYDFPGSNIPFLHGFYFPDQVKALITFKNNDQIVTIQANPGDIIINKSTDIIKIEVSEDTYEIIEFYVSPAFALKHNEPGVWVPIF